MGKRGYFAVLLIAAAAAGGYWYWTEQQSGQSEAAAAEAASGPPPAPVETALAETGTVRTEVEAAGSLLANESVVITSEIAGRIDAIPFTEGQAVERDEVLIGLDSASLEAELQQAQANLELARMTYERNKTLVDRGSGTRVSLDESSIQYEVAKAEAAIMQTRLAKTSIAAPFTGVVGLRSVSTGDYVTPGEAMVTLTSIDPIKVDFRVPELFLGRIGEGQAIEVRVDAFPGRTFTGEVYAVDPTVDVNGRAVRMRARIANEGGTLKPGLFARVSLVLEVRDNAVLVPESALVPQGRDKYVYRVEDGTAVLTRVEIGNRLPGKVEIVGGLDADATVVTAGQLRLRDGARVNVVASGREG